MLVSYKWLQSYFEKPLPPVEDVVHAFTFGAFEIEGTEEKHGDTIIDIKVLPDRACYCLSHRGIAKELSALLGVPMKQDPFVKSIPSLTPTSAVLTVRADPMRSPYYATALIKNVHVAPSPQWLKEALESMGQRSINNVVDATNYVMLDLGTPLHAFDAKKTSGHIDVRSAKEGETITLLGGAEKTLTGTETLITDADTGAALALAGVKGGALAELDAETTDIIVEAATFDPVITRKTAAKHDVRTDASKRFENKVAPVLPAHGMEAVVALITTVAGGVVEGYAHTDMPVTTPYKLGVSVSEVNRVLGTAMEEGEVRALIERLGYAHEYLHDPRATFLEIVRAQLGKPYKLGASVTKEAPALFDCSSLVAYAAAQAGVSMPRISIDQYVWTDRIEKAALQPGDVVFFNTQKDQTKVWYETKEFLPGTSVTEGISHVGVYMGDGMLIHARKTENAVVEEPLDDVERRVEATVGYGRVTVLGAPRFVITVPPERYDLRIKEDLIEEIGRAFGYGNIVATRLPQRSVERRVLSTHALAEKARAALSSLSFQEVYTYALRDKGDAVLSNALASDKSALRSNLSDGLIEALTLNEYNAPLLGLADVRVFEVGTVFGVDDEEVRIGIAARASQGKKRVERTASIIKEAKDALALIFGEDSLDWVHEGGETAEFNLTAYAAAHPQSAYAALPHIQSGVSYSAPSPYPFVLRDIALWVPGAIEQDAVQGCIRDAAGNLLIRIDQFDRFEKEGRVSYAFHLVFQSREKTLSDEEVTARMNAVVDACVQAGYEVR